MKGWRKESQARYHEMLEVLPPAMWIGDGFLVGEPWDHDAEGNPRFEAHFKTKDGYVVSTAPMTGARFAAVARAGGPCVCPVCDPE
jgi:hypothetical protein